MERARRIASSRGSAREVEADILAELRAHLEHAAADLVEQGLAPEAARREAERRFGDLAGVFGACRTEKLRERIMLQRILLVLVAVLAAAVFAQSWVLAAQREESRAAIEGLRADLAGMTGRIEEQVAAALLVGGRRSPFEAAAREPAAEGPFGASREPEPLADDQRRADLVQVLRHDPDPARRFEAVDGLRTLALASDDHRERPLRAGHLIEVLVPGEVRLSFEDVIDPRGNLRVPDLGFIPAVGLTRSELELVIQREFEQYHAGKLEVQISKAVWAYHALIEALQDSDPFVRLAAARALGAIGDHRARRALQRTAIDDGEQAVREAATEALERFR